MITKTNLSVIEKMAFIKDYTDMIITETGLYNPSLCDFASRIFIIKYYTDEFSEIETLSISDENEVNRLDNKYSWKYISGLGIDKNEFTVLIEQAMESVEYRKQTLINSPFSQTDFVLTLVLTNLNKILEKVNADIQDKSTGEILADTLKGMDLTSLTNIMTSLSGIAGRK